MAAHTFAAVMLYPLTCLIPEVYAVGALPDAHFAVDAAGPFALHDEIVEMLTDGLGTHVAILDA
jgi:hypothetical protein